MSNNGSSDKQEGPASNKRFLSSKNGIANFASTSKRGRTAPRAGRGGNRGGHSNNGGNSQSPPVQQQQQQLVQYPPVQQQQQQLMQAPTLPAFGSPSFPTMPMQNLQYPPQLYQQPSIDPSLIGGAQPLVQNPNPYQGYYPILLQGGGASAAAMPQPYPMPQQPVAFQQLQADGSSVLPSATSVTKEKQTAGVKRRAGDGHSKAMPFKLGPYTEPKPVERLDLVVKYVKEAAGTTLGHVNAVNRDDGSIINIVAPVMTAGPGTFTGIASVNKPGAILFALTSAENECALDEKRVWFMTGPICKRPTTRTYDEGLVASLPHEVGETPANIRRAHNSIMWRGSSACNDVDVEMKGASDGGIASMNAMRIQQLEAELASAKQELTQSRSSEARLKQELLMSRGEVDRAKQELARSIEQLSKAHVAGISTPAAMQTFIESMESLVVPDHEEASQALFPRHIIRKLYGEIIHICKEVMRIQLADPMSLPATHASIKEKIQQLGSLAQKFGLEFEKSKAEEK